MLKRITITCLVLLPVLMSCGNGSDASEVGGNGSDASEGGGIEDYMPLEVGDWVSMRETIDGSVGGTRMEGTPSVTFYYYEYTGIEHSTRYDCDLYKLTVSVDGSENYSSYYRSISDGQYLVQDGVNDQVVEVGLEEPLVVGHTWSTTARGGNHLQTIKEIVAIDELVTVPAGSFTCVHVHTQEYTDEVMSGWYDQDGVGLYSYDGPESITEDSWFAPGIGLVKTVARFENNNQYMTSITTTYELTDFGPR